MGKTAVAAPRTGDIFVLPADDERLVIVNDQASPLYDDRIELPVSEELAISLAREGQIQNGKVIRDGELLKVIDGRQRLRAMRYANEGIRNGDSRFGFREGKPLPFKFEVLRVEDQREAVRQVLAANLRVDDTPVIRARRIARALKWGLTEEEVRVSYGFKTMRSIQNALVILDCSPSVQAAIERGDIAARLAPRFAALTHEKQEALLAKMIERGATKGQSAEQAVSSENAGGIPRMRSRAFLERFKGELEHPDTKEGALAACLVSFFLGEDQALQHGPGPFAEEILAAAAKAAEPKRKKKETTENGEGEEEGRGAVGVQGRRDAEEEAGTEDGPEAVP